MLLINLLLTDAVLDQCNELSIMLYCFEIKFLCLLILTVGCHSRNDKVLFQ